MSRWNVSLMAAVVVAVNGLIKCITCILGQQVRDDEKVINLRNTNVLTDALSLFFTLPASVPKSVSSCNFPLLLCFPSPWCKVTVEHNIGTHCELR